jgi:hypothetical protein
MNEVMQWHVKIMATHLMGMGLVKNNCLNFYILTIHL